MADLMEVVIERAARVQIDAIKAELGASDPINSTGARVVYLVPGEAIVWDVEGDCFGQLTARVASMTAHRSVSVSTASLTPCSIDYWVVTTELTLLRCAATLSNSGAAPTAEALSKDGFLGAADMGAMMRALMKVEILDDILQWTPQGPNGGRFGTQILTRFKVDAPPCY